MSDSSGQRWFYAVVLDIDEEKQAASLVSKTMRWQSAQTHVLSQIPNTVIFDYDPKEDVMTICVNSPKQGVIEQSLPHHLSSKNIHYIHPEHLERYTNALQQAAQQATSGTLEYMANYAQTGFRWKRAHYVSLADEESGIYRVVGRVEDIDNDMRRELELRHIAQRDAMTGLLNHGAMQQSVNLFLQGNPNGTFFILDIDDFKRINDTLGHLFGDSFLQAASAAIKGLFRKDDLLGRIGGDEFAIFLPHITSQEVAKAKAQALLGALSNIPVPEIGAIHCSIGVAISTGEDYSYDSLFKKADISLYQAKHKGKNCFVLYGEDAAGGIPRSSQVRGRASTGISAGAEKAFRRLSEQVFDILYHAKDIAAGIQASLAFVGERLDVSRVYIFEGTPSGEHMNNTFEWCNEGVEPQIQSLQEIPYEIFGEHYQDNFNQDGVFYCQNVATLPQWQQEILEPQNVKSMLQYALLERDCKKGFIGFDECRVNRFWTQEQVDTLVYIAEMITLFLRQLRQGSSETTPV